MSLRWGDWRLVSHALQCTPSITGGQKHTHTHSYEPATGNEGLRVPSHLYQTSRVLQGIWKQLRSSGTRKASQATSKDQAHKCSLSSFFANMWERGLSRFSLLTQKNRLLMHLWKLWHKMTVNVIAATCVASNLQKQPKWGSVTYLEYFGTYLGYLSTNCMSQHSATFPANPTWIPDIPHHCLPQN
jgi:hypothetical protein